MSISTKITVDTSELKKGMRDAESTARSSMQRISNVAKSTGQVMQGNFSGVASILMRLGPIGMGVAAAIIAIGGAAAVAIKSLTFLADKIDSIAKAAKSIETTVTAYMALQHAANRAGVEMEKIESIAIKLDAALTKAADGNEQIQEAFYSLGLSWRELERLTPEKRIIAVTDAIRKLKEEGGKMPNEIYSVFSKKDMQSINKIVADDEFSKNVENAKALGHTIREDVVSAAEQFKDVVSDIKTLIVATIANIKPVKSFFTWTTDMIRRRSEQIRDINARNIEQASIDDFLKVYSKSFFSKNVQNLTEDDKRSIIRTYYNDKENFFWDNSSTPLTSRPIYLSGDALDKKYKEVIDKIDFSNMSRSMNDKIFSIIKKYDPNWSSKKEKIENGVKGINSIIEKNYEENKQSLIRNGRANDDAERIAAELDKESKALERTAIAKSKAFNAEEEIARIEEKHGAVLDEELKEKLRQTAKRYNLLVAEKEHKEVSKKLSEENSVSQLQLKAESATLQKNRELSELYQKQLILKKMGIEPTMTNLRLYSRQLSIMTRLSEAQKKLKLGESMQKDIRSMQLSLLEKAGYGQTASLLKGRQNAEETLGRSLTNEERLLVDRLSNLQYSAGNVSAITSKNDVIKTNALASRGGFASSVAYDKNRLKLSSKNAK